MSNSIVMSIEQFLQEEVGRLRDQLERERQENERLAWMLEHMTHGSEALLTYLEKQWHRSQKAHSPSLRSPA